MPKDKDPVLTVLNAANSLDFLAASVKDEGLSHILKVLSSNLSEAGEKLDDADVTTTKINEEREIGLRLTGTQ